MPKLFDESLFHGMLDMLNFIKLILQSSTEYSIIVINPDGKIILWNEGASKLYGYSGEEAIGAINLNTTFVLDGNNPTLQEMIEICKVKNKWEGNLLRKNKDGKHFCTHSMLNSIKDLDNNVIGFLLISKDITNEMKLEKVKQNNIKLAQISLEKDRFLAGMSHELRTPLNAIIGFTSTLLMEMPGKINAEQKKQLTIIKNSGLHLLSLINDILDIEKIQANKITVNMEKINITDLMLEVVSLLSPAAEKKNLLLQTELSNLSKENAECISDRRIILQILLNLVNNAIKYTKKGKVILTIEIQQSGLNQCLLFHIKDTGIGIKKQHQKKIFQAFEQLQLTGISAEGTGLGLHLSFRLARLLKGTIKFNSVFGKGSTFTLAIPFKPIKINKDEYEAHYSNY